MAKKRVHELAKEINIESKEIIQGMSRLGINLKSHMSTIEDKEIELYLQNYHNKDKKGALEPVAESQKPPAREFAKRTSAPHENQSSKPQDDQKRIPPDLNNIKRQVKNPRHDRGPGLVDRVPSRPPDRRFEDFSAHPVSPKKPIPVQPGGFTKQPVVTVQPKPPVDPAQVQQLQPVPAQTDARKPDMEKADLQTISPSPKVISKDRPKYPERNRPAAQMTQEQHKDRRPAPTPGSDRGVKTLPGDKGQERPKTDDFKARFGDRNARPASGAPAGRGKFGQRPVNNSDARKPSPLKVPKVPEQAKGIDKIKASEKSRTRFQTQAKGFSKVRDKVKLEADAEARGRGSALSSKKRGAQLKGKTEVRPIIIHEKKPIVIGETVTVQELAEKMKKSPAEVIKRLMLLGILATINQEIDSDTASILAAEFGFEIDIKIALDPEAEMVNEDTDDEADMTLRPCVVTVMGHVDHGKTSLLDAIRETDVIATEAGGITQHIGAYQVEHNNKKITFVDTPGHEAFTAMRARGAQVTDIAVLVVAADDGVMPQTVEAINHAKAAGVPIIVAMNKMDKLGANPEKLKQQLTEYELLAEEWGGDTICVPVSAKAREGLENLLENILLVAEVNELKANRSKSARGTIIEAELDKGRGPVATVLIQNGTLQIGDDIVAGVAFGRVRAMMDDKGRRIKKAGPSTPVEVLGFHDVPLAGDAFYVVKNEKTMKQIVDKRVLRRKQEEQKNATSRVSLDDLFKHIKEGGMKELHLVVKADVQGSVEAIRQSLERLSNDEVKVNIIHCGVGAIRETDIMLASASNAIVIGFNVHPDVNSRKVAENEKVDIRLYRVIYDAINDIKAAMSGLLDPELREVILGRVEIRKVFKASKLGTIAGCYVIDGKITRDSGVRLLRDDKVIYEGKLESLKRFKDDVKEVVQGYECGLTLENYQDIREGDVVEVFTTEQIKRELS